MAFTITHEEKPPMYISDKRLYLTPSGEVSEEPVSGGSLLVSKGGELSPADAARYGLTGAKAEKPAEDKARKGTGNKAAATTEE